MFGKLFAQEAKKKITNENEKKRKLYKVWKVNKALISKVFTFLPLLFVYLRLFPDCLPIVRELISNLYNLE